MKHLDRQIHSVIGKIAVLAGARELVMTRLTISHAVPVECGVRAYDGYGVDRVHMIRGQYQTAQRVATESVHQQRVIHALFRIGLAVP